MTAFIQEGMAYTQHARRHRSAEHPYKQQEPRILDGVHLRSKKKKKKKDFLVPGDLTLVI